MNEAQAIRFLLNTLVSDLPFRLEEEIAKTELEWHKACVAADAADASTRSTLIGQQAKLRRQLQCSKEHYDHLIEALHVLKIADEQETKGIAKCKS